MKKSISVIIPVWNRSDLTAKFLQQNWMAAGHHDDIEWIIIDNGSTDNTLAIAEHWKAKMGDKLNVLMLGENTGFGPANNRGAEVAHGDILVFISNDVQVLGDYLTPIKQTIQQAQGPALFGPEVHRHNTGWNTYDLGIIEYVAGWCVIVERDYWKTLCEWDEQFVPCDFEDMDLSYQMTQLGHKLIEIGLPLSHGGLGNSGQNLSGGRLRTTINSQKLFIEKWDLVKE